MPTVVPLSDAPPAHWGIPDLAYLRTGHRPAPPLPLQVLGSFWSAQLREFARSACAPADYSATTLLAAAGALIANVRWPRAGADWSEPPILWMANVGSPG